MELISCRGVAVEKLLKARDQVLMKKKGTVYIIDDDAIIRRSIGLTLKSAGFVPYPFVGGTDFIEALGYLDDGCILLDIHMPGTSGLDVQEQLIARNSSMPLLIMTGAGSIPMAVQTIKRGAFDFIEKPFTDDLLIEMLDDAFGQLEATVSQRNRRRGAVDRISLLTARELDILAELAGGRPNKQIAFDLGLSVRTIEMHRGHIMHKLGIHSTAEALQLALDAGLHLRRAAVTPYDAASI
jgi:two-component system response regulator FixJ